MSLTLLTRIFAHLPAHVRSRPVRSRRRSRRLSPWAADVLESRTMLAATLWVDPGHAGNFTTIQSAVNAAHSGNTIKVVPGTYVENVTVPAGVSNLTILGGQIQFPGQRGASIVESDSTAFSLQANDTTLKGFTFKPATAAGDESAAGVLITAGTGDSIQNNVFEGIGFCVLSFTANNTISGNTVVDCVEGVDVTATSNSVTNNLIEFTSDSGISVVTTGSSTVSGNTVENCDQADVSGAAINILADTSATVIGNTADDNTGAGIMVNGGTATVESNKATYNSADGIDVTTAAAKCTNNTATNNAADGLNLNVNNAATVTGSTADKNGSYGFDIQANTATVSQNVANNNGDGGFGMTGTSSGTVTNNSAAGNTDIGLEFSGATVTFVFKNNSEKGSQIGISLFTHGPSTISGNTADNNIEGFVAQCVAETITGNTADFNAQYGFNLLVGPGTVSGNTADFNAGSAANGFAGFLIETNPSTTGGTTFTGNTASGNSGDGFALDMVTNSTFSGNTTNSNGGDGIDVDSASSGNTFTRNTALGNHTFDLSDQSSGNATDGTANTWTHNTAGKTNPPGL